MKLAVILEQLQKELAIRNYSPKTIANYCSAVRGFSTYVHDHQVQKVDGEFLRDFFYYLKTQKNFSYSSMKLYLAALQFLYQYILKQPVDFDFKMKLRKQEKLPVVLSVEEVQRLINSIVNLKHKTIIMMIYGCGLRISEVVKLKWSDIDRNRKMLRIEQAKGRKDRYVILTDNLLELLTRYYNGYRSRHFIFEGQKGNVPYSPRSIQSIFRVAKKKAGITKKATVHTLRHSFAAHLLDQGTDIRYIQELLGHKNLSTTQIYTHISTYDLNKISSPAENIVLS